VAGRREVMNAKETAKTAAAVIKECVSKGVAPSAFGGENGHPGYKANVEAVGRIPFGRKGYGACETSCCAFCGRLALGAKFHGYFVFDGEFDEAPEDPEVTLSEAHIGFYPLGSDCARRLKKMVPVYKGSYRSGEELVRA
jgi:hypothetical protein